MSIDQSSVSRRTIAKGAAWSVPAVAVAAAAPSLAASHHCEPTYQEVTKDFTYYTEAVVFGSTIEVPIDVVVTATGVPLTAPVGATLTPIQVTSKVTIPGLGIGVVKEGLGADATQFTGTSDSSSVLTGILNQTVTTDLTIPMTPIPESGDLITTASGSGNPLTVPAGNPLGGVTITMGEPSSILYGFDAAGNSTGGTYKSTLFQYTDGSQDYTLATFEVVACP